MIQANELRIGNWVLDTDNKPKRIDEIFRENGAYVVSLKENIRGGAEYAYYLNSIPLTPEILEKAGFTKVAYGNLPVKHLYGLKDFKVAISEEGMIGIFYMNTPVYHIQAFHQLQNLYFALTGEELEISL